MSDKKATLRVVVDGTKTHEVKRVIEPLVPDHRTLMTIEAAVITLRVRQPDVNECLRGCREAWEKAVDGDIKARCAVYYAAACVRIVEGR